MKRKLKRTLILVFLAVASLFILAGCSFKYATREEVVEDYGLEASVTYYGNGGVFENNLNKKTLDYMSGQPAINIGVDKMKPQRTIKRDDYTFDGWYYVVLDGEGNPTYTDETQTYMVLGEAVDFTKTLEVGEHWIVAASWKSKAKVQIMLVIDEGVTVPNPDTEAEQKEFSNGDLIATRKFDNDGTLGYFKEPFGIDTSDDERAITFLDYYTDAACENRVERWPIAKEEKDTVIYARYLVGAWELVKDVDGVDKMFKAIRADRVKVDGYWIYDDIDMFGQAKIAPFTKFNAVIHSEGATIKNLVFDKSGVADKATTSIFGKIGDKAELVNVHFENLSFSCSSDKSEFNAYFVFESLSDKARIENVTIAGTFNVTISSRNGTYVPNLMDANLTTKYDHFLFGGYETDDAYLAASAGNGFKVLGASEEIVQVTQGI